MTKPPSNSRRFVNAAWALLTFQLIASAGAVAVTGVAAFHVRDLISRSQQAAGPVEEAVATEGATDGPYAAAPVPSDPMQATPVNDGPGALTLALDERGNINASLSDPDGISTAPQIQWLRSGVPVPGATGQTYTVQYADSQSAISARADYLDGDGFRESVVSQPVQIGVIIP